LICCNAQSTGSIFRYDNDPIDLPGGETTTYSDWQEEIFKATHRKGRRWQMWCPYCHVISGHIASRP
jgi:hypothetical protein